MRNQRTRRALVIAPQVITTLPSLSIQSSVLAPNQTRRLSGAAPAAPNSKQPSVARPHGKVGDPRSPAAEWLREAAGGLSSAFDTVRQGAIGWVPQRRVRVCFPELFVMWLACERGKLPSRRPRWTRKTARGHLSASCCLCLPQRIRRFLPTATTRPSY